MCLVCSNWQKAKMNIREVDNALAELIEFSSKEEEILHYMEALEKIKEEIDGNLR